MALVKILVVEDDASIQETWEVVYLGNPQVQLLQARTIEVAREMIEYNPDIKVAFLDGDVPDSNRENLDGTLCLIAPLREIGAIIVPASSNEEMNKLIAYKAHQKTHLCFPKQKFPDVLEAVLASL